MILADEQAAMRARQGQRKLALLPGTVLCPFCRINPTTQDASTGELYACKPCCVKRCYIRKYNLSLIDYFRLLRKQDGKCVICHIHMDTPCVDHCHTTQRVRGLLCCTCNLGLGAFKDSENMLKAAADYLKRSRL